MSAHHDPATAVKAIRDAAAHDSSSVLDLAKTLIHIPTRGGIDPYEPVIDALTAWCEPRGITPTVLTDTAGDPVGVTITVEGAQPGPTWVFDACLDTAPFGSESAWKHGPTAPVIHDGWLYGRGSADSKAAVAILCHLAHRLSGVRQALTGRLVFLFDLDEHTGGFGGAKAFFTQEIDIAGVMIAYPGINHLITGGRGVHRLRLTVHGKSGHSGSSKSHPNAIVKAAEIIRALSAVSPPAPETTSTFPLPGKVTVSAVTGGEGFSVNPDRCCINVDIRTTPAFDAGIADAAVKEVVSHVDSHWPTTDVTDVEAVSTWPPYALDPGSPLPAAIIASAGLFGLNPRPRIAGPSNIGNYLAGLNIPATAGFGVDYEGLHAVDERIRIASIPPVQATYHSAALRLLVLSTAEDSPAAAR